MTRRSDTETPQRSTEGTTSSTERSLEKIPAGEIRLRDEGTHRSWSVDVKPFLLSRFAVTRERYASFISESPLADAGPRTPVTDVSWKDAIALCNRLSDAAGHSRCYSEGSSADAVDVRCDFAATGYRLPTEAWEHACRAGSDDVRYADLAAIAWYRGNSDGVVRDVGSKQPNAWGLYDMIGNAWEWCWDVYDPEVYGPYRVFRGGGFADPPRGCRASCRRKSHPTLRVEDLGFGLARSL